MTQQVAALGGAGVLDAHRDGGGAHALVEVVVRSGSGRTGGIHHGRDHPAVKVAAVVGEVLSELEPNGDVVGLLALKGDAEPADERCVQHQVAQRLASLVTPLGGRGLWQ